MKNFIGIILFIFIFLNGIGLLLGMEDYPGYGYCWNYKQHEQSNFEYYFLPIISYACSSNGGLLQPAFKNFFYWFGETHK